MIILCNSKSEFKIEVYNSCGLSVTNSPGDKKLIKILFLHKITVKEKRKMKKTISSIFLISLFLVSSIAVL